MIKFKHKTIIPVRFADVDMMGHVNNAVYATYVESARLQYFKDVVSGGGDWSKQEGLIMAKLEINFLKPLYFGDSIQVLTKCSRMGTKSFDLDFMIVRITNDIEELIADGKSVIVCFDYTLNTTVVVSEKRRGLIEWFEK